MISCDDLFFVENTMILGRKVENLRIIPSEDLFYLENTINLGQKWEI